MELYTMSIVIGCMGLIVGSFLNVLIDRLPQGESVLWGRSHCDYCKKTLRWYELIPIISFVLQRGACRRCHARLSFQYPLVELITAICFSVLPFFFSLGYDLLFALILVSVSIVITMSDSKYQIIPDSMVVLGSLVSFAFVYSHASSFVTVLHVYAGVGAASIFYALWFVTKGRGMGFGDVKLSFMMGLLLGFPGIIFALYIAFLTGAITGVILIGVKTKSLKSKIAFGPFLILGMIASLLLKNQFLGIWKTYF